MDQILRMASSLIIEGITNANLGAQGHSKLIKGCLPLLWLARVHGHTTFMPLQSHAATSNITTVTDRPLL